MPPVVTPNPTVTSESVPIAFSDPDIGGIGLPVTPVRFHTTVVKPYFDALREKEEEAGGSCWDTRRRNLPVKKSGFQEDSSILFRHPQPASPVSLFFIRHEAPILGAGTTRACLWACRHR